MIDIKEKLTVVITGHYVKDYEKYLTYLIHSLKGKLDMCNFLLYYDETSFNGDYEIEVQKIHEVLKNYNIKNYNLTIKKGGLLTAFYYMLNDISTPYFLFLEHDWVFLDIPNYDGIVDALDNHPYVKFVQFKKLGNIEKQLNSNKDYEGNKIPFIEDNRVGELPLIQSCYWSNNPFICKKEIMLEWSKIFLTDTIIENIKHNTLKRGSRGIEEIMIKKYIKDLENNLWVDIKDNWGSYLYGNVGMNPIVGHTDGSNHYDGIPEQLGKKWIEENKNDLQQ